MSNLRTTNKKAKRKRKSFLGVAGMKRYVCETPVCVRRWHGWKYANIANAQWAKENAKVGG